ncbi:hypothetical protein LENED_003729 [Lentinula edodes]|uniref:Uncharacterized protein n=1 Tax=Lentinula edodes TaxID=5353 RepID=A0A1Q3E4A7_LENED|nr:hypothetical protein LENED_003729 [Lentinula edodes]
MIGSQTLYMSLSYIDSSLVTLLIVNGTVFRCHLWHHQDNIIVWKDIKDFRIGGQDISPCYGCSTVRPSQESSNRLELTYWPGSLRISVPLFNEEAINGSYEPSRAGRIITEARKLKER